MLLTEPVSSSGITLKSLHNHGPLLSPSTSLWLTLFCSLTTPHLNPLLLMLGLLTSLCSTQPEETHVSMNLTHALLPQLQMLPRTPRKVPLSSTRRLLLSTTSFKTSAQSLATVTALLFLSLSTSQVTVWFGTHRLTPTSQLSTAQFTRVGSHQSGVQTTLSSTMFARTTEELQLPMSPTPPVLSSTQPPP